MIYSLENIKYWLENTDNPIVKNRPPDLLIQALADAKANLITKGWVINHN